jgi:CRP-like cAMP-binding protein
MTEQDIRAFVAQHPTFKDLAPEHIRVIAEHASDVEFKRGVLIFRQHTEAEYFYLIRKGQVTVEIPAIYGGPIIMQTLGPGDVLGWSWIFPPYQWHFDARASEDTSAVQIDGKALRARCEEDTRLGYDLVKYFAAFMMERLNASRQKVMDLYAPES